MNIYIMRHGTTVWNENGITQGRSNNRLSKSGKELTEQVSANFKDVQIDLIFVSPLMRTMQTSNIINTYHNVKIIKDERLIEIHQGIFTGKKWSNLTKEERELKNLRDYSCGMESYESVYERVNNFIQDIKSHCPFENILIITHNVCASLMYIILSGQNVDILNNNHVKKFKNAEIKKLTI